MTGKCEICGKPAELTKVSACACDETAPHALLCKDCKKKYFDYMLDGSTGISPNLPSVTYIPYLSYAGNLVYAHYVRFGGIYFLNPKSDISPEEIGEKLRNGKVTVLPDTARAKEAAAMKASYNGFTGIITKMDLKKTVDYGREKVYYYDISIYDSEKQATYSFTGVKLEDVKFLGAEVSFNG